MLENPYYLDSPDDSPSQILAELLVLGDGTLGGLRIPQCFVTNVEVQDPIGAKNLNIRTEFDFSVDEWNVIPCKIDTPLTVDDYDEIRFGSDMVFEEVRDRIASEMLSLTVIEAQ